MKLLTEDEKIYLKKFIKWAIGFTGCGVIFIDLITTVGRIYLQLPINWKGILPLLPVWFICIYIGRRELPLRSIYFWLIFLFWACINFIKLFFYKTPLLKNTILWMFLVICFIFLINDKRIRGCLRKINKK